MSTDLEIGLQAARVLLEGREAPRLIDCREPEEWEICRLPGAELLPLSQFAERFREVLPDPAQAILIYCHHGMRSLHAAEWLRTQGFTRVHSLAGGIDGWAREFEPAWARY